jgi:hypothetical protein
MKEITPEQLKKAYMNVFNTDTGKLVLDDLAYRCFKYTTTVEGSAEQTMVNEGRRQTLLHIESMLEQIVPQNKEV